MDRIGLSLQTQKQLYECGTILQLRFSRDVVSLYISSSQLWEAFNKKMAN